MKCAGLRSVLTLAAALALPLAATAPVRAENPKSGGILTFVVPDEPPSWDAHRETTFALIHPFAPFYSVLIKVNPDNPSQATLQPRAGFVWVLWSSAAAIWGVAYYAAVHG